MQKKDPRKTMTKMGETHHKYVWNNVSSKQNVRSRTYKEIWAATSWIGCTICAYWRITFIKSYSGIILKFSFIRGLSCFASSEVPHARIYFPFILLKGLSCFDFSLKFLMQGLSRHSCIWYSMDYPRFIMCTVNDPRLLTSFFASAPFLTLVGCLASTPAAFL